MDPESVGLQEETTHSAKIGSFARDPGHLDFLDVAARRDPPGGWSAQFSTPTIATVNVTELLAKGTLDTTRDMQLQIAGPVIVNPDGSVLYLNVTSAVVQ